MFVPTTSLSLSPSLSVSLLLLPSTFAPVITSCAAFDCCCCCSSGFVVKCVSKSWSCVRERERKQERMSSKIRMRRVYVLDPTPAAGSCKPPCCSVVFVRAPPPCYVCWCARVCLPMRACVCVLRFECVAICVCCCCFFFYHLSGCACAALPLAACSARALLLLPAACCLLLPSSFRTVVGRQARA